MHKRQIERKWTHGIVCWLIDTQNTGSNADSMAKEFQLVISFKLWINLFFNLIWYFFSILKSPLLDQIMRLILWMFTILKTFWKHGTHCIQDFEFMCSSIIKKITHWESYKNVPKKKKRIWRYGNMRKTPKNFEQRKQSQCLILLDLIYTKH